MFPMTVCILGTNKHFLIPDCPDAYMGIGQIRRHIGDANLAGNN